MRFLLPLACLLCPWQIYVTGTPLERVSLLQLLVAPLLIALAAHVVLEPAHRTVRTSPPVVALAAFAFFCASAAVWSADSSQAILTAVKIFAIVIVAIAYAGAERTVRHHSLTALTCSAVVLAGMVVLFRLNPLLELAFWISPQAEYVLDPDVRLGLLSGTTRYNVFDSAKAGGVFSNGNVASLYLGFVGCLLLPRTSTPHVRTSVIVIALGVIATGSKSGLASLALCGALWLWWLVRNRLTLARASIGVIAGCVTVAAFGYYILRMDLLTAGDVSLATRADVWRLAVPLLADHPLLGLGFGGWEQWSAENFRFAGITQDYPPHNLLLIAWSWVGLGGALLIGTAFGMACVEPWTARGRQSLTSDAERWSLSLAFLWFLVHAMLDNAAFTNFAVGLPIGLALGSLSTVPRSRVVPDASCLS